MASILGQLVIDGLGMGMVYVLLASGFNLIISVSGVLFIAYGQFYMLGAYILWGLMVLLKVNFFISLCVATIVPGYWEESFIGLFSIGFKCRVGSL